MTTQKYPIIMINSPIGTPFTVGRDEDGQRIWLGAGMRSVEEPTKIVASHEPLDVHTARAIANAINDAIIAVEDQDEPDTMTSWFDEMIHRNAAVPLKLIGGVANLVSRAVTAWLIVGWFIPAWHVSLPVMFGLTLAFRASWVGATSRAEEYVNDVKLGFTRRHAFELFVEVALSWLVCGWAWLFHFGIR